MELRSILSRSVFFVSFLFLTEVSLAKTSINLKIKLQPAENALGGVADIQFDAPKTQFEFMLHQNLKVSSDDNYSLELVKAFGIANLYRVQSKESLQKIHLQYRGVINEPIVEDQSPGIITDQGVSLLSDSFWFPRFKEGVAWKIGVEVPSLEWKVMIPGKRTVLDPLSVQFEPYTETNELVMVADRYTIFEKQTNSGQIIQVWLKANDKTLANSYLDLMPGYIENYSSKIGAFPFTSYAVIENSLETGYAFPGFTLLGPSVIQLPFLLRSSLPHEILHSWWGNSVLVDYDRGNWCEGLTSYMADLHYANVDGKGVEYRRSTLQKFQDFVHKDNDFPLRKFVSRNDLGTQAVGYGKSLMLFQMLENWVGSNTFYNALSQIFTKYIGKEIAFAELQQEFEQLQGTSMESFFGPWLDQLGAPTVTIESLGFSENKMNISLKQSRPSGSRLYMLPLKIRILYKNEATEDYNILLAEELKTFSLELKGTPKKLWVDPDYEVFRTLFPEETPFAISQILSQDLEVNVSVPANEVDLYRPWAKALQAFYSKPIRLIKDSDPIPPQGIMWIVGNSNQHAQTLLAPLGKRNVNISESKISYGNKTWELSNGVVFAGDLVDQRPVVWIWTNQSKTADVLVQKIKHYTTFSIVGFTDQKNDLKVTWPVTTSPLIREL